MSKAIKSITVYLNKDSGQHTAVVEFAHPLTETDTRPGFHLGTTLPNIRRMARSEMIKAIAAVEKRGHETLAEARNRVRKSLSRRTLIDPVVDPQGRWHGASFAESWWMTDRPDPLDDTRH